MYIDIKSVQINFLGGRLFFKGVRYHGENETVYIHNGYITWRYWLRVTKQIELCHGKLKQKAGQEQASKETVDGSETSSEHVPSAHKTGEPESRIMVAITGLEWFIYNRTPVYDAIVEEVGARASSSVSEHGSFTANAISKTVQSKLRRKQAHGHSADENVSATKENLNDKEEALRSSSSDSHPVAADNHDDRSVGSETTQIETEVSSFYSLMLRFFPIGIECSRGAISLGNENTKALVVTTFDKAKGHIDAGASGPHDIYRQIFDFGIDHPTVQMKPNPDYHVPQMAAAERVIAGHEAVLKRRPWWRPHLHFGRTRRTWTHGLRNLLPYFRRSVSNLQDDVRTKDAEQDYATFHDAQPDSHDWHGLDRYMDEDEGDDHHTWLNIDYARFSTLFDCPHVHLNFYWDTPGVVQAEHCARTSGLAADLNRVPPPAYGMHLDVYGGLVNYGPWSDRLRVELQNAFLPTSYKHATPRPDLSEGETRLSTVMSITIDIKKEITLRIPVRESSKDWRWRGRATAVRDAAALRRQQQQRKHFRFRRASKRRLGPDVRPFGWLSISAGAHSHVQYVMDMYPGIDGYRNTLQVSLRNTKATSSVNHANLWDCARQDVSADLSNPLGWNELHTWRFDIMNESMNMFLLRDHTFLLLDLISDFTAGLTSDYMTFMPFHYIIGIKFVDFNLYLNANDNNIIDNPCDVDDNAFLVLGFSRLAGQVDIPMDYYSPLQSSVNFVGDGQDASLSLKTPSWHTLRFFGKEEVMATLKTLQLEGSYNYFSDTSPKLTDSLFMTIIGGHPKFHLQGYLIRFFMNVKDNYFGDTIHFSTLEEYQAKLDRLQRGEEDKKPPPKKENDLDVILSVRAENAIALMPSNLYSRDEGVRVDVQLIEADMRFTNYYMDLQVASSPVEVSTERSITKDGKSRRAATGCQLFIDGISVYGHRLFGAPPTEPTYLCNWDFDVGEISGECTTEFVRILIPAIMSFLFTMDDDENALPKLEVEVIPDVTFLRMRAAGIHTWIVSADAAVLITLAATTVELNDWANQHFSKYVKVDAPLLLMAVVDGASAYRQRDAPKKHVPTYACVRTSLKLAVLDRKANFAHETMLQQQHIRLHDSRTRRADWLLHKQSHIKTDGRLSAWNQEAPAMPLPPMPEPIDLLGNIVGQSTDIAGRRSSSFLSVDTFGMQKPNVHHEAPNNPSKAGSDQAGRFSSDSSMATHNLSSPWTKPRFQLQSIQPDLSFLPKLDTSGSVYEDTFEDSMEGEDFPIAQEDFEHDGIFCHLVDGVTAFCTPDLVRAVVDLLNEASPQRPESILDDLQTQVVSNIRRLTAKYIGKVDDLAFRLPAARVRMINPHEAQNTAAGFDQYDMSLEKTRITVRIAPAAHAKSLKSQVMVHASLQDLGIEIAESIPQTQQLKPSAEISLSGIGLWLSLKDEIRARTQVGGLELLTTGENIDNLAGLIQRSEAIASQIVEQVQQIDLASRTQHMLYHLTSAHQHADPPFMSRAVNVLRTTEEHVRLHDSWKMIIRLRNILSQHEGEWRLEGDCVGDCPHENDTETQEHILSAFNQWKLWEASGQDDNALVQAVFGPSKQNPGRSQMPNDIEVELLLGRAALTLDPGPRQSQLYVQSLDLNIAEKPSQKRDADWTFGKGHRLSRSVQAYCGALGCHLHWELLQLVDKVADLSKSYKTPKKYSDRGLTQQRTAVPNPEVDLTLIFGADAASVEIQSTNLRLVIGVERLKMSFATAVESMQRTAMSIILNASSGRLRMRGPRTSIFGCKVTAPTIYVSIQDDSMSSRNDLVIHSAATCGKLRLHLKEDILGLMRLTRAILKDEFTQVQHLQRSLAAKADNSRSDLELASGSKSSVQKLKPHVALFLDDYMMQFDLMSYLRYKIAGKTARTSVIPHSAEEFSIQLDIKQNQHSFENPGSNERSSRSVLTLPPISAAFSVALLAERVGVDARAVVEMVILEASAVRACFDAAYKPQTIQYVKEIKQSFSDIQEAIHEFAPVKPQTSAEAAHSSALKVQYRGDVGIEGVRIHCRAPALRPDLDYSVDLNIVLGSASLKLGNLRSQSEELYQKPHFDFGLRHMSVILDRVGQGKENFGSARTSFRVSGTTDLAENDQEVQNFHITSDGLEVDLHAETVVLVVDLTTFLQARVKSLAAAEDAKRLRPLRRLTVAAIDARPNLPARESAADDDAPMELLNSTLALELNSISLRWLVGQGIPNASGRVVEDMAFTINKVDLRTKREASARLAIRGMQLQMVPQRSNPFERSANSALLPEMVFHAAYTRLTNSRKFAFKAAGKLLDVRLASNFIIPASAVQRSLARASAEFRTLKLSASTIEPGPAQAQLPKLLGNKRLAQLLVFAEFGGAQVTVSPAKEEPQEQNSAFGFLKGPKRSKAGRYGQAVQSSTGEEATLRAPGIAIQVEYADRGTEDPTLNTEIRVSASSNTLAPSVVPLILEISASVTNLMEQGNSKASKSEPKMVEGPKEKNLDTVQSATDPSAILGRVKLNAGLLVQKQEFSLTCQPIARVSATARFDEIVVVVNTVQSKDQERFFSIITTFNNLAASVQHVYSRESTASFTVDSIMISLMNSKHFSNKSGISAILDVSPMKAYLNAKQMQDFLLFREIWYPAELRAHPKPTDATSKQDIVQGSAIQRLQEATATAVLPWHAVVSVQEVMLQVDFGQSIGKSDFAIEKLWASSKKSSDSEQNLCIGFDKIGIESHGRMSGFVALQQFRVRTAIRWPMVQDNVQAPLVQGSVGFENLRAKAVFDYQPFAVADVSSFDFLIYNVRQGKLRDRLVGILDGGKIQAFGTTTAAAQGLSIAQAFERLIQEKQEAFESSLHELDKYLRRKSVFPSGGYKAPPDATVDLAPKRKNHKTTHAPRLHVDVVITLRAIDAGVFMTSFFDETTLKLEAINVQARFAVGDTDDTTHSGLGMSLGQVRLALSAMSRPNAKALGEISVTEVIDRATSARGGTILKVPRLVASMETWQKASANVIEYIFSSTFHGKVDIGWNYSRISTIRRMWENHSRALAQKMSKPLPPSAIKITAEPKNEAEGGGQEKITAVVNMPQSKYEYIPLEPPIIDTPQLRDLGEATPSLEWIGLQRERLPHVTHGIIIVSLLEVAKEIEDTYSRILGSG